ncbi:MAG: hypothetical protein HGA65_19210 [Oscillochloris sp.]|nr:hypothetical protein [Oscillochloris sp.]
MYEQLMGELAGYVAQDGLSPADLLGLPDGVRRIVTWLNRHGAASLADLAGEVGCGEQAAATLANALVGYGLLSIGAAPDGTATYSVRMTRVRSRGRASDRLRDLFDA